MRPSDTLFAVTPLPATSMAKWRMKLSAALTDRGINVQPIVYPAVEDDAARLRFFLSSTHTEAQIEETLDILAEELARIRGESAQGATVSL